MVSNLRKLVSYYKPYKKTIVLDLVCSALASTIVMVIPLIARNVTTKILNLETNQALNVAVVSFVAISVFLVFHYLCIKFANRLGKNIGESISCDMRLELFKHYQEQSFSFFDDNNIGKLVTNMYVDIHNISDFLHRAPETVLNFFIQCGGAFIIFFSLNVWFSLVIAFVFILVILYLCYFAPIVQKNFAQVHEKNSDVHGYAEEILSGIRIVQSLANENFEYEKFKKINLEYLKCQKDINEVMSFLNAGLQSVIVGLVPILTMISVFFVINGDFWINDLVICILYMGILITPIFAVIGFLFNYQEAISSYKRFLDILAVKPEIVDSPSSIVLKNINGDIEFKNVSFRYQKSNKNIFENLNLKLNAGENVVLVGASGTGKSTICNLIPRFYEVLTGEILLDGVNIKDINLKQLRSSIGFVHQETFLFSGTIMENVRYGNLHATDNEVFDACKRAYAHDFILNLSNGYDTQVGPRGLKLSGGQKQRIAIARAFLKNPPILIFDEATSCLDNENEQFVQLSIEELSRNRTTILVTHTLSAIKKAKRVLVIEDGKIS